MQAAGYTSGANAGLIKKIKIASTFSTAGVPAIGGSGAVAGCIPATTTNFTEGLGLALDTGTYTTTQATSMVEGVVSIDVRPGLIMRALLCGGATDGTALAILTNTSASAGGTTVTAANVQATQDQKGGTVWGLSGNNVGYSRIITTHTSATSIVVTVPFPNAIAVGDTYLMCPHSNVGDGAASSDGIKGVTLTTLLDQVDSTAASGAVAGPAIVDLELNGASDSYVLFINTDHVYLDNTL